MKSDASERKCLYLKVFSPSSMLWTIKDDKVCDQNICRKGKFSSSAAFLSLWTSSSVVWNEVHVRRKRREKLFPADLIRNKSFSCRLMNSRLTKKKDWDGDRFKNFSRDCRKNIEKVGRVLLYVVKVIFVMYTTQKPSSINCQRSTCQQLFLKSRAWNRLKSFPFAGNLNTENKWSKQRNEQVHLKQ